MSSNPTAAAYRAALQTIWERSDYDRGFISNPFTASGAPPEIGLLRTAALLDALDNPHHRYGIVHVAGSKGKGSTSAFLEHICRAAGYRTGLYTSPHLHTFRERVAVDGQPISPERFAGLLAETEAAANRIEAERPDRGRVTAFELITALALSAFSAERCDLAIVEVGLGGTYDATNVVDPLVAVITTLDFEHTHVLGETMSEIAGNKAGIVKAGRPVVSCRQPEEAIDVIVRVAADRASRLLLSGRDWTAEGTDRSSRIAGPWGVLSDVRLGLAGRHQIENAGAAVAATWLLADQGWSVPAQAIEAGLAATRLAGRFEAVERHGRTVILDGAHSPAAAAALAQTLQERGVNEADFIVGMLRDKDPEAFLEPLSAVARRIAVAPLESPRAMPVDRLAEAVERVGLQAVNVDSVANALVGSRDWHDTGGPLVVTGSLSTVAEARTALGLASNDPSPGEEGASPIR